MRIISQRYIGGGQFMLQLGGLSSETKPTDAFVATGSQFFEDDTDAVFTFSGLTWNLEKNGQMKDLPVVTATDNGKVLKVKDGVWSVGEDGGGSGGGGAEKFVVTLTQENDTWTADKTVAEIVAAYEAKQVVVCRVTLDGLPCELPLKSVAKDGGDDIVFFCGTCNDGDGVFVGTCVLYGTECSAFTEPIPTSAPLIVTLTAGATENQLVGDKTYKEVYDAFIAGQNCILIAPAAFGAFAVLAVGHETDYTISAYGDISATGAANDYITVTVGG